MPKVREDFEHRKICSGSDVLSGLTDCSCSNAKGSLSVVGYLPVVMGGCTAVNSVKSSDVVGKGCGPTLTRVVGG